MIYNIIKKLFPNTFNAIREQGAREIIDDAFKRRNKKQLWIYEAEDVIYEMKIIFKK